jgi:hypothetical protein
MASFLAPLSPRSRRLPGRLSFVVAATSRNRLIVKSNSVERTVDKVIQFGLEIWESAERESVDPTCAGLVTGKNRLVDDRKRTTQIRKPVAAVEPLGPAPTIKTSTVDELIVNAEMCDFRFLLLVQRLMDEGHCDGTLADG